MTIKLVPDHKGFQAKLCGGEGSYYINTAHIEQRYFSSTPEAAAAAWNEGSVVQELVEVLESIMSLVKVHQKHPIIAEKVQQAQQALNKAKGVGDDK